ncbi:MAG: 50S ribosomal protein L11 [Euryarchaeota archaeon]|nr:50S ribosomal protein L11 [Euryarchaeota archaeon]
MAEKTSLDILIEGGKATPGPPIGSALGPLGVNVAKVVETINEKTKEFAGMQVPVKVIIDKASKEFEIQIGTPPASALIKRELKLEKGSATPKTQVVGNLTMEQVIKITKMKIDEMLASDLKAAAKEIVGSCVSLGITIEGKPAKEVIKEISEGKYDQLFVKV